MPKPVAVLISDVHYNLQTLEVADKALRLAVATSNELEVPLIVAGDLHDTKANLRAECINAMQETFRGCRHNEAVVIVGNHDKINEKSKEHALNFLDGVVNFIVDIPGNYTIATAHEDRNLGHLIPYQHDVTELRKYLKTIRKGSTVIMHQGVHGSDAGEYIQDPSALNHNDVAGLNVISGHYHRRQTIKLPNGGQWNYIGNPYTLGFGEANHPAKGFQILMDDKSLKFVPTNLRKHIVHECDATLLSAIAAPKLNPNDLLLIKMSDTREKLISIDKKQIGAWLSSFNGFDVSFKLDLIPTDSHSANRESGLQKHELIDSLIDDLPDSQERKARLKQLWKDLWYLIY